MNRLILLGNGFDLAHGLKTDYNSFIIGYLKKCLTHAYDPANMTYDDELITVTVAFANHDLIFSTSLDNSVKGISELVDFYYTKGLKELLDSDSLYVDHGQRVTNPFKIKIKSAFFNDIIRKCSHSNWVAIENEFYAELKRCLKSAGVDTLKLKALNESLKALIRELELYLSGIDTSVHIEEYSKILLPTTVTINNSMILNFNYTDTVEKYIRSEAAHILEKHRMHKFNLNYIHGKINDEDNPLVFGFGDELDADYHKIELANHNQFFEYIKSFWYFRTVNYSRLIEFLNTDQYEILILGHSCGLSDRTLLNMVFEHKHCSKVRILYHDGESGNNYTNLTYEISRHFRDKVMLREKVVPFPECEPMPQLKKVDL